MTHDHPLSSAFGSIGSRKADFVPFRKRSLRFAVQLVSKGMEPFLAVAVKAATFHGSDSVFEAFD